jgi:hypothetical protein
LSLPEASEVDEVEDEEDAPCCNTNTVSVRFVGKVVVEEEEEAKDSSLAWTNFARLGALEAEEQTVGCRRTNGEFFLVTVQFLVHVLVLFRLLDVILTAHFRFAFLHAPEFQKSKMILFVGLIVKDPSVFGCQQPRRWRFR